MTSPGRSKGVALDGGERLSMASGFFSGRNARSSRCDPVGVARDAFGESSAGHRAEAGRALSDGEIARAMEHLSDMFLPIASLAAETGPASRR